MRFPRTLLEFRPSSRLTLIAGRTYAGPAGREVSRARAAAAGEATSWQAGVSSSAVHAGIKARLLQGPCFMELTYRFVFGSRESSFWPVTRRGSPSSALERRRRGRRDGTRAPRAGRVAVGPHRLRKSRDVATRNIPRGQPGASSALLGRVRVPLRPALEGSRTPPSHSLGTQGNRGFLSGFW